MPGFYTPHLMPGMDGLSITGEEAHHLNRVLRKQTGDTILLNSGKGLLAEAEIMSCAKTETSVKVIRYISVPPPRPYALAFSLLKSKHDEMIVEKLTELGASALFPMLTRYSVRQESANALKRFERIALAAIKQCDNPFLPQIFEPMPLAKAIQKISQNAFTPVLCSERRPQDWLDSISHPGLVPCFLIGPEGGWSAEEYQIFADADISEISISKLILRAETAAMAIASQWNLATRNFS